MNGANNAKLQNKDGCGKEQRYADCLTDNTARQKDGLTACCASVSSPCPCPALLCSSFFIPLRLSLSPLCGCPSPSSLLSFNSHSSSSSSSSTAPSNPTPTLSGHLVHLSSQANFPHSTTNSFIHSLSILRQHSHTP